MLNLSQLEFSSGDTAWESFNEFMTLVCLTLVVLFPLLSVRFMIQKWDQLKSKGTKKLYGELYEGYESSGNSFILQWFSEHLRKFALVVVVVFTTQQLWLQMFVLFLGSTLLVIISGHTHARPTRSAQLVDQTNEIRLIFIMYHMMLFTSFVPDHEARFDLGYSCSVYVVSGLAINMAGLIIRPLRELIRRCKLSYFKR